MLEKTSTFQKAIEAVEALDPEAQAMLVDIIQKRLTQQRRDELLKAVAEAENDYAQGNVRRGSVADLMAELDE
jgi:ribosome recycling factor